MSKVLVNEETLQNIAQAIRDKNETQDVYYPSEMPQAIEDIITDPTGDANATTLDIINPKTAYVQGSKLTGQIIPEYEQQDGIELDYSIDTGYLVVAWCPNIHICLEVNASTKRYIAVYDIGNDGTLTEKGKIDNSSFRCWFYKFIFFDITFRNT